MGLDKDLTIGRVWRMVESFGLEDLMDGVTLGWETLMEWGVS